MPYRYQAPGSFDAFWKQSYKDGQKTQGEKRKGAGKGGKKPQTGTPSGEGSSNYKQPSMARRKKKKKEGDDRSTMGKAGKNGQKEDNKKSEAAKKVETRQQGDSTKQTEKHTKDRPEKEMEVDT